MAKIPSSKFPKKSAKIPSRKFPKSRTEAPSKPFAKRSAKSPSLSEAVTDAPATPAIPNQPINEEARQYRLTALKRQSMSLIPFAVGTPVTRRPPHRSQRAGLPHWAPTSGCDAQTLCLPYSFQRSLQAFGINVGPVSWQCPRFLASCPFRVGHIDSDPGTVSGTWFARTNSPWSGRLAPRSPPTVAHRSLCSSASQLLSACQTSRSRTSPSCSFRIHSADPGTIQGQRRDLPAPV